MSTSVKFILDSMRGAPVLSGLAGSFIPVLDALLITGWGGVTALSGSVSGGIATLLFSPGDSFVRDAVVLVSGATPSEVNGEARVSTTSNTSITFPTTAADGAITGTIAVKYAPQSDWEKVFSGTRKAVYKSNNVQASGHFLRVDDTGTQHVRVRGFETMTDVDTGTGPFPSVAQESLGGIWFKSHTTNSTATGYSIFCDERFLLVCNTPYANATTQLVTPARGFGDPIAFSPSGDVWGTILCYGNSTTTSQFAGSAFDQSGATSYGGSASPRPVSGVGSSVVQSNVPISGLVNRSSGSDPFFGNGPSTVDGRIITSRVAIKGPLTSDPLRSEVPGFLYIPQDSVYGLLSKGDVLNGSGDLAGRRLLVLPSGSNLTSSPSGAYLVDMTGPWR